MREDDHDDASAASSASSPLIPISMSAGEPWKPRHFTKAGTLRVQERYWRRMRRQPQKQTNCSTGGEEKKLCCYVLPDALTWRKYLSLLPRLIQQGVQQQQQQQQKSPPSAASSFRWILLESAAELLDYRNQSPTVVIDDDGDGEGKVGVVVGGRRRRREAAASQERSTLVKLVQHPQEEVAVSVFCDLSVRQQPGGDDDVDDEEDEWEWLDYENLTVTERCRHALVRAGRMLLEDCCDSTAIDGAAASDTAVVLIVSDEEHRRDLLRNVQLDDQMKVVSMEAFVTDVLFGNTRTASTGGSPSPMSNHEQQLVESLLDLLKVCEEEYEKKNSNRKSPEQTATNENSELSPEQIQLGLRNRTLLRGRFEVTKDNPREAFVSVSTSSAAPTAASEKGGESSSSVSSHKTYFIDKQRGHFQHAFHGDIVILQPMPKEEWGRPVGKFRLVSQRDDDDDHENDTTGGGTVGDLLMDVPSVPSARVVAISEPSRRTFVATVLDRPSSGGDSHVLVVPMDVRVPKIRIRSRSGQDYVSSRLKVQVDGWDANSNYPHGRCIEVMGPIGDLETEIAALLHENQINLDPFSTAAMSCLPPEGAGWTVQPEEIEKRRDLRSCRQIFSVDPPGCQDIDDSMHAFELPNGDIEVGVHIADVTHFVQHNSALDNEAASRGTTFYLVDRRFDMLPSLLSSNLCSLHGGIDRLAVSAIWTFDKDLKDVESCWYGRTVIHNCAAMTYDQADYILEGKSPDHQDNPPPPPLTAGSPVDPSLIGDLKKALTTLTRLARNLRETREAIGGAVDLSSGDVGTELKFTLVDGRPTKVVPKKDKEIHHTIAELMILANTYVATKIYTAFPDSALLRIHRSVEEDRFGDLREMLEAAGISLTGASNFELANTLKNAQKRTSANSTINALYRSLASRAMSEANYVCTGGTVRNGVDFSHYGLGLEHYTHFTSPIRRYADVVVHKQLLTALRNEQEPVAPTISPAEPRQELIQVSLPESNVASILAGGGLERDDGDDDDDVLDALIEGASELALGPAPEVSVSLPSGTVPGPRPKPYATAEVSRICDGLNLHTRLAKHSSRECQQLFLSLYFRENVERTSCVVVNLRANGFWAYVPKFDLRVPVYIKDMSEQVQIDPGLLGLPADASLEPTAGFAGSRCRLFPNGKCELLKSPDERLVVTVPGASTRFIVRPFDVLTVQLTCDNWDIRARVPSPRVQLLKSSSIRDDPTEHRLEISSEQLRGREGVAAKAPVCRRPNSPVSIFEVLSAVRVRPIIDEQARIDKQVPSDRNAVLGGRLVFGSFVNPDSRAAVQEVNQQNAAAESALRRQKVQDQAARRNEYDTTKGIESSTMARQQRRAAEKRNTRRSKAN